MTFIQTPFATVSSDGFLCVDGVSVKDLKEQYGTPLYIMSEGHVRGQMQLLRDGFMDKYPNTLALFASKAMSCLYIYKLAKQYNIGLDCVSAGEISIALKAGVNPDLIYFHGNNKLPEEIEYALRNGVCHFVVDNFHEIEIGNAIAKKLDKTIFATVRVTPGVQSGGHKYIQTGGKDTKFGFSTHDDSYLRAIKLILNASNIEFEGIHCHIGSQIFDLNAYKTAMEKFVEFAKVIYDEFGVSIRKLNAGGGYGIAYNDNDKPLDFHVIVDTIMETIQKGFKKIGLDMPFVLIEPGRFVVGNAGITLYELGSSKTIPGTRKYISVDGGMTDNIRTALYQAKYQAVVANKADQEPTEIVTIAGKNCESGDILIYDCPLADPKAGDLLAVFSTGAYNYSMSSNYNQLPKPAVVFTYEGKAKLAVRRQTFADLTLFDVED